MPAGPPVAPLAPPSQPGKPKVWRANGGDLVRGEKVQVLPDMGLDSVFGVSKDILRGAPNGSVSFLL